MVKSRMDYDEFTAKEAVRVLRRVFPKWKTLDMALLNYYKRTGILKPSGTKTESVARSNFYTLNDIVLLAWVFEMRRHGTQAGQLRDIIYQAQRNQIKWDATITKTDGPLTWTYSLGELAARVRGAAKVIKRKKAA